MIEVDPRITPADLSPALSRFWEHSGTKLRRIREDYDHQQGSPVFTVGGTYTTRGWTEWTQGFEFGAELLQYDATGDPEFLEHGRRNTMEKMAPHLTHTGVHDHGFNNISTYGNLLRLIRENRFEAGEGEEAAYEVALKCSGAVQAMRWSGLADGGGYIYSFNGPHSLFADTIRSLRSLAVAHQLGHVLMQDHDEVISLLDRLIGHA
ncbi:MAG: glycosyl hydrolase, partial [Verrucomicrobiota bacterium]